MLLTNKINSTQQQLEGQAQSLSVFLQGLKEERQMIAGHRQQRYPDHHASSQLDSQHHTQEHPLSHKDIYSEGAKSLCLVQTKRHLDINEPLSQKYQGDTSLKNRSRLGHGNRFTLKQYQIPPHFFTPAKDLLQNHLRHSRVLPNLQKNDTLTRSARHNNPKNNDNFSYNLAQEAEFNAAAQSKVLSRSKLDLKTDKIYELNPEIALKYCLINKLTQSTDAKQILIFFVRLLEILGYAIPEPKIQKYKDCIIFYKQKQKHLYNASGRGQYAPKENSGFSEGMIYFFNGSLYIGELYKNAMHGLGIRIFFRANSQSNDSPSIFKGEFRDGLMKGYFQVKKEGERYSGDVQNGVYHGYGKLSNSQGSVAGQFRNGKLVGGKFQPQKQVRSQRRQHNMIQRQGEHSNYYKRNLSMVEIPQNYSQKPRLDFNEREPRNERQSSKRDAGTMMPSRRTSGNFNQAYPSSFGKRPSEEAEMNPWSNPHSYNRRPSKDPSRNPNDLLQFSYPFGNDLSEQIEHHNTSNYRSRLRPSHYNPEQRQYRREGARYPGSFNYQKRKKYTGQAQYPSPERLQRVDSSNGQDQPLESKC